MSNPSWNHTVLRVKSAEASAAWYVKHFGFSVVDRAAEGASKVVYAATLPAGTAAPAAGFARTTRHVLLGFRSDAESEADENFAVNAGNTAPHRGFGHVAVLVDDVYATCDRLVADGVKFKKLPDEGNMKGLAFAYDADGYWVEIIARGKKHSLAGVSNLSQTMIRVKDADKSLAFYNGTLGLTTVAAKHFPQWKFSLYFLASMTAEEAKGLPEPESEDAFELMKTLHEPIVELTHNHDSEEVYHNGHDEKPELRGFVRLGFLVDSVDAVANAVPAASAGVEEAGVVYVQDPDGYYVQLRARA